MNSRKNTAAARASALARAIGLTIGLIGVAPFVFAQEDDLSDAPQAQGEAKQNDSRQGDAKAGSQKALSSAGKRTQINFEDQLVEGQAQKPELFYLLQQRNANFKRLIRLRDDFLPEMRKTADEIQRRGTSR